MIKVYISALLIMFMVNSYAVEQPQPVQITCDYFTWGDVETLVQPYISDYLFTALVQQGQSANYHASVAAEQAYSESFPEVIKKILKAIIKANC